MAKREKLDKPGTTSKPDNLNMVNQTWQEKTDNQGKPSKQCIQGKPVKSFDSKQEHKVNYTKHINLSKQAKKKPCRANKQETSDKPGKPNRAKQTRQTL